MQPNPQFLRLVAGIAILVLGAVACHGAPTGSGSYVPVATSSAVQANGAGSPADQHRKSGDIDSTCGTRLHIVLLGIVDCKFDEKGYDGKFRIFNKTQGIVTISPSSGDRNTTFTVVGALIGKGAFFVRDKQGHHLILRVRVTL